MPSRTPDIPLCRSEFLQDVTIAIGQRQKGFKYHLKGLSYDVIDDYKSADGSDDGDSLERLTIRCADYSGSTLELHIWEDRSAQLQVIEARRKHRPRSHFSFCPDISNFTPEGIFAALKESASTRYSADELTVTWEHKGQVA